MATFTLTAGADNFTGTAGQSNIYSFTPTTLSAFDTITGTVSASFWDVLQLTAGGTVTAAQFGGVTNMEALYLSAAGNVVTLANGLVVGTSLPEGIFAVIAGTGVDSVNASGVNTGIRIAFQGIGGNDTFIGGTSDDFFLFAPSDATVGNTLTGGSGIDTIQLLAGGVVAANAFTNVTGIELLGLSNAGNTVTLTNALVAGGGVFGVIDGTGDDVVDGSGITSGVAIHSNGGNDNFHGGSGNDFFGFYGFNAGDLTGADTVVGGGGFDVLFLGSAGTIDAAGFAGVSGIEALMFGAGNHTVTLSNALITGSSSGRFAVFDGSSGSTDTVDASAAAAGTIVEFHGVDGADTYIGGAGNDYFVMPNTGFAQLTGNGGLDRLLLSSAFSNQTFDLTANASKLSNIEIVSLAAANVSMTLVGADIPTVNAAGNLLYIVGAGDDQVNAGSGWVLVSTTHTNAAVAPGVTFAQYHHVASNAELYVANQIALTIEVNNPTPVVATSAFAPSYTEDGAPTAVDTGFTVSDLDDTNLESGIVSITGGLQAGDVLSFTPQFGITDTNAAPDILALSGSATLAEWQTVLQSITFSTTSQAPGTSRTVSVTVNDGDTDSAAATKVITVTPVNDAPAVATSAFAPSYTEDGAPTAVDTGFTVSDVDDTNLESASVSITGGLQAGDVLGFTPQFGIIDTNAAPEVLALSGSATLAQWATVLQSITFSTTSQDPGTSRTVSITVNDGDTDSAAVAKVVAVTPVNDAPTVATSAFAPSFTEDGAPTAVDTGFTVGDVDDTNLESASVTITGGLQAGDVLSFTPQFGITDTNAAPEVLALSGTATLAEWQTVLQSITFSTTSQAPGTSRTVSVTVNDGDNNSAVVTKDITVTPVNDAPAGTDNTVGTPEGTPYTFAAADFGFTDTDANALLAVRITTLPAAGTLTTNGTPVNAGDSIPVADIVAGFLVYTPPAGGGSSFTFQVQDDGGVANGGVDLDQTANTLTILINTPPVANDDASAATEKGGLNNAVAGVDPTGNVVTGVGTGSVADTDAEDPSTALVVVAVGTGAEGQPDNGTVGAFFSGSYGQLRLMADGSYEYQVNQTNALVQGLHTSADTLTDVFHYTIEDTVGAGDDATFTITIHGANDLPQAIADTGSMTEESAPTSFAVRANDTLDPDSTAANTISITGTVTATGPAGTTINDGDATAVVSGNDIQVTLNGDFQQLALTETATVTVPYTLTGDAGDTSTANLVVTVNGANDVPIANDDTGSMSENDAATLFNVRSNDTLDVDHTALNNISIGTVTASGPAGDGIDGADVTTAVVGNQVQITLGADFQNLGAGETATIAVPYTLTGDQPGDTDGATLTVTVNGTNDAPVAGDFTFNGANAAIGNTSFVVNDPTDGAPDPTGPQKTISGDLLAGATDVDTPANLFTITPATVSNAAGSLTIEADGDFTYLPAPGFTGDAVFTYTLNDNDASGNLTDTGTVTIEVATPRVWYVDDSAAPGGDGTSDSPFDSLADVSGAAGADQAGDIIYLFEGNYSGGVTLLDNQTLWGAGTALTVNGTTLAAAGTDPVISNAAGSGVTVEQGNTLTGFTVGNTTGFDIANTAAASVGTLTVSNVTLNGSGGLFRADSGGTLNVQLDSATTSNAGTHGIQLVNVDNSIFGVTGVTTINDATTDGIAVSNSQGSTFTFTGLVTILNDGGANGDGVDLQNNNTADSTFNFNGGVDITVNGTNAYGFRAQSSGTVNILDPGGTTTQIISNNGTAIFINPTTFNATLDSVTSTGDSGTDGGISLNGMSGSLTIGSVDIDGQDGDGIDITNLGSGASVTINGGTIGNTNDPAGVGVDINGGLGNITISATINHNTAGTHVVEVSSRTTGTVDFNGNITASGNGTGIDLTSNTGGTVRFDGGMTLSTGTGSAFNSSGGSTGATLVITDPAGATNNTLTTTTGTALNVANTTIGAEDLTFQSISAGTGAGSAGVGISLDTTGSLGGLHVTGNGAAGTGGTIQHKTGADGSTTAGIGIFLNNTSDVQLNWMQLNDFDNFAIRGNNVTDFQFDNSVISGTNGTAAGAFDEAAISFDNLLGSASISDSNIGNGFEYILKILNSSGTLNRLTIDNTDFGTNNTALGGDAVQIVASQTATVNVTVTDSSFTNAREDLFNAVATQTADMDVVFRDNTLSNNHTNKVSAASNILVFSTSTGDVTYDISHNSSTTGATGSAIAVAKGVPDSGSGGTMTGTVNANTIGVAGVVGSGSEFTGIFASALGSGTHTTAITNNTIRHYNEEGIFLKANDSLTGGNSVLNATVTGNITTEPDSLAFAGLWVVAGSGSGTENNVVNVVVGNISTAAVAGSPTGSLQNDFTNGDPANSTDVFLQESGSNSVINLSRAGSAAGTAAGVIQDDNVGSPAVVASGTVNLVNTLPPTPPPVAPLLAADGGVQAAGTGTPSGVITAADLDTLADAAVARWAATGLSAEQVATLDGITITVADLAGDNLGTFVGNQIVVDSDAAGRGWFIDDTPLDDVEFGNLISSTQLQTDPGGAPAGHFDLLTLVMHEMGHGIGLDDQSAADARDELMFGALVTGERRLPGADDAAPGPVSSASLPGWPADKFAAAPSALLSHIADFGAAQGDTIDLSALVATLPAKLLDALLQVREDASDAFATLQVNARSVGGDQHWVDVAQFVGMHAGDAVNVVTGKGDLAQGYADWLL